MIAIIINCLIMLFAGTTISYMNDFRRKYVNEGKLTIKYYSLGMAIIVSAACNIIMLLTYGSLGCYFFYALDRFCRILFVGELILNAEMIVAIPGSGVSKFVSILTYSSIIVYFVDTVTNRGVLEKGLLGVFAAPVQPLHRLLYFIIYAFYFIGFCVLIIYKLTSIVKKREKYELTLLSASLGFCAVGFLVELFVFIYFPSVYIPSIIFNYISLIIMFHLIIYNRLIQLRPEDFGRELHPSSKDIVFVLNDELEVVFINKRAEVMSIIVEDNYIGRKIDEIFEFNSDNYNEILNPKEGTPFGSSAEYNHLGRHVNMVFDHRYDRYGDIFSSCVTLYNMEPKEMLPDSDTNAVTPYDEIQKMYDEAREMTKGKKALIIDEDITFLEEFVKFFDPYEIEVERSVGGRAGIEEISNKDYDIVFVGDGMIQYGTYEVSKTLREMPYEKIKNMPLILVTGEDINNVFHEMLEAGFTDYISKPIQPIQLNSSLTRWLWDN